MKYPFTFVPVASKEDIKAVTMNQKETTAFKPSGTEGGKQVESGRATQDDAVTIRQAEGGR